ncbi:phosphatidate cytidylyltransferase [Acholeplasma hippikon]|uniref:Phosphatidate cytidylyltransferase n=1 Tax=Acholeplasma hippikon TaxID=264636 RepID=A0A449BL87_9MOLU|nr:phosphatidate cytidylyltransferase [Acholeplasma hippikon]VEU83219.1 Phosphatidate cytidylyltransferase [Acholeplasma hippikon]
MKQRIITGIILALLLVPIVSINHPVVFIIFQIVLIAAVIIASYEMLHMYEKEKKINIWVKIVIVLTTIVTYFNVGGLVNQINFYKEPSFHLITFTLQPVVITSFITVIMLALLVFVDDFSGADIGKAFTIVNYVGLGFASITMLRYMGVRFIIYIALIASMTDIFAYFVGVKFGKHKMAPNISPKKSWEGAIGGTIMGTLIASSFALFYGNIFTPDGFLGELLNPDRYMTIFDNFTTLGNEPLHIQAMIIIPITLLGTIAGQIGDLVASKFKRTYQIKDFGKIMPGHGGVLDRFDSILFIGLLFLGIFIAITVAYPII